jgi:hypothetical protein
MGHLFGTICLSTDLVISFDRVAGYRRYQPAFLMGCRRREVCALEFPGDDLARISVHGIKHLELHFFGNLSRWNHDRSSITVGEASG